MWTNLVQQADIFLVLGEMTQQDNYIHMGAAFNFLQDCPLRHHGDRDGRFPQHLNGPELHSLFVQF